MKRRGSIGRKVSLIILAMVLLSTSVIGAFSYILYRSDAVTVSADKAMAIAEAVSAAVDGGQLRGMLAAGEQTDYWYEAKEILDKVMARTGAAYLYLLDKNYSESVTYFMEGTPPDDPEYVDYQLGETEAADIYADEMFETMETGKPTMTDFYDSGEYGMMVSGFSALLDENGEITGVVGVDISIDDVLASSRFFGMIIIISVIAFSAIISVVSSVIIRHSVTKPISALSESSVKLAKGDMDIELSVESNDEIGALTEAFMQMTDSTRKQIEILERLSSGDLSAEIMPRSEKDDMSFAIKKTFESLNSMFGEINSAASQVKTGSEQLSHGSQILAQGSAEQAASVSQLSSIIEQITRETGESAGLAEKAANLSNTISQNAKKGSSQMDSMMSAVREINEASQGISKVMKVIDDIAFQTNILALNAAVEAARAGAHGKGFAVVAEEVRSLAAKSAEAAKDSESLITNSMSKAELGAQIAGETAESLSEIVKGINESNRIISEIAKHSIEQQTSISQINGGVSQVSLVVQQNSATAQESAAASEEMNGQAIMLEELVARFKLAEKGLSAGRPSLTENRR